jgi:hypothetical protein
MKAKKQKEPSKVKIRLLEQVALQVLLCITNSLRDQTIGLKAAIRYQTTVPVHIHLGDFNVLSLNEPYAQTLHSSHRGL